jgi:hypothetical protein
MFTDSIEIGSGNHILWLTTLKIIAVDPGLAGPQAVSSVDRKNALQHRDKTKTTPEDAACMVLFLFSF